MVFLSTEQSHSPGKKYKKTVAVSDLHPGMTIAEPVMNAYGAVVAWEDTELGFPLIGRLVAMGVAAIRVYSEIEEIFEVDEPWLVEMPAEIFAQDYDESKQAFRKIFDGISIGRPVTKEQIDPIIDKILKNRENNSLMVDCIMEVRSIDEYTYHHCINVSMIAMMLGRWLRVPERDIPNLIRAGLLHDVGKSKVPDAILNKPFALTAVEFAEMKRHPEYGYQIVKEMKNIDPEVGLAVLMHHERENGSGYPLGIMADKISLFAKILAVSDIFDAMTANRVYRPHEPVFHVFNLMQNNSFGMMDPVILKIFLQNITYYYNGKHVLLSDGRQGEIVFMNQHDFARPVVKVQDSFIDLSRDKQCTIVDFV